MHGRVALVATVTRRPPPSIHYHLHLLHFLPVTCLTVIIIDIPARSAGGGLHGHFSRWRGRHRHESTPVATTPSSSCVARGGSRLSRPLLAAHHHLPTATYIFYTSTRPFFTMARAPSPRKHPRSDDALVVVRCTGRVALVATVTRRPPPSTHYHLHLLHSNAFSDEVAPAWTYLVLTDGEHSVYAPAHSRPS